MRAISIKKQPDGQLLVNWDDGHSSLYSLPYLRTECPCAGCKGEVLFGKVYRPASLPVFTPGMNEIQSMSPVGQYGIQTKWKDGHDTGIYSWDYLRLICPCEACTKVRESLVGTSPL